jgi:hypothetical protein
VLSSGLEISLEKPIPNVGSAKGVVSYIVGRTFAQADAAGFTGNTATTGTGSPATGTTGTAVPATAPTGVSGVDAAGLLPGTVPGVTAPATAPVAAPVPTVDLVSAAAAPGDLTKISFYPLLAAIVPLLLLAAVGARRFV